MLATRASSTVSSGSPLNWTCRSWSTSATSTPVAASARAQVRRLNKLTDTQQTYNKVIRGIRVRTSSLVKTAFESLPRVTLGPAGSRRSPLQPASYSSSSTTGPP